MILRTIKPSGSPPDEDRAPWSTFAKSQEQRTHVLGYITQPAHAALAGRLARVLNGQVFDEVSAEIIEIIGDHDVGWSETDLAALEDAEDNRPVSFLSLPSAIAVRAWRRSIAEAEMRSSHSASIVRSHFCLLTPQDDDVEHRLFRAEEEAKIATVHSNLAINSRERDLSVDFLGFCDLLSLLLCSGWPGSFMLRLAHPARPSSGDVRSTSVSLTADALHIGEVKSPRSGRVYVNGWERTQSGLLRSQCYEWELQ